jgi:hypothetical protein
MQTEEDKENPFDKAISARKIILFNGPPRCGKSLGAAFVANFVRDNSDWMKPEVMDFAEPLKKAAHALFCAFHDWGYYDRPDGESQKSLASGDFLGLSPREAYIALSEDFLKPKFGEAVIGYLMRKRICRSKWSHVVVIPNSGFIEELAPLVDLVGQRNIMVIEVHMAGKTFEGDSRGYIGDLVKLRWPHVNVMKLPNVFGDKEDKAFFRMLCEGAVKKFLKIEEKE